jgi:uncharacterized phage-associated protein
LGTCTIGDFPISSSAKVWLHNYYKKTAIRIGVSMMNVSEVADYLIAYSKVRGDSLLNQKLNQLLYYAEAWYLAVYDEGLFTDSIEAWECGSVVPSVYQTSGQPKNTLSTKSLMSSNIRAHLDAVMKRYYPMTNDQLGTLIKHEAPWILARNRMLVDGLADEFFQGIRVTVRHGGNRAFYSPGSVHIQMPVFQAFDDNVGKITFNVIWGG